MSPSQSHLLIARAEGSFKAATEPWMIRGLGLERRRGQRSPNERFWTSLAREDQRKAHESQAGLGNEMLKHGFCRNRASGFCWFFRETQKRKSPPEGGLDISYEAEAC
jgi:hypothetical protein